MNGTLSLAMMWARHCIGDSRAACRAKQESVLCPQTAVDATVCGQKALISG